MTIQYGENIHMQTSDEHERQYNSEINAQFVVQIANEPQIKTEKRNGVLKHDSGTGHNQSHGGYDEHQNTVNFF